MADAAQCSTCRFFMKPMQGQSVCRRMPPQVIVLPPAANSSEVRLQSLFPPINDDGLCGEYHPAHLNAQSDPLQAYRQPAAAPVPAQQDGPYKLDFVR